MTHRTAVQTTFSTFSKVIVLGTLVLAFLLGLFVTPNALAETEASPPEAVEQANPKQERVRIFRQAVKYRKAAYAWARRRGVILVPQEMEMSQNTAFEVARRNLWKRKAHQQEVMYQKWLPFVRMNQDFDLALRAASRKFGVSFRWLHNCALSEGHIHGYRYRNGVPLTRLGIDPFWMNEGGSGAGGPLQFMEGTFDAYPQARTSLPAEFRGWHDKLAQAYTGAWIFAHEGSGQWEGAGC